MSPSSSSSVKPALNQSLLPESKLNQNMYFKSTNQVLSPSPTFSSLVFVSNQPQKFHSERQVFFELTICFGFLSSF